MCHTTSDWRLKCHPTVLQSSGNISFSSAFLLTLPIALRGIASTKRSSWGTYRSATSA